MSGVQLTSCDEDADAGPSSQHHGGRHSGGPVQASGDHQRQVSPGCLAYPRTPASAKDVIRACCM